MAKDDEYEEVYKQGKELIEKFGDSYLGKGKTKNIEGLHEKRRFL
ncbi:MAG: hypothetical protein QXQ82_01200 [Candidatus Pacearchaeota archaeon]